MHILAFWGHCTIGCWLYALTRLTGVDEYGHSHPGFRDRLWNAMLFSLLAVALFSLRVVGDW